MAASKIVTLFAIFEEAEVMVLQIQKHIRKDKGMGGGEDQNSC